MLQLRPGDTCNDGDVFHDLTSILNQASDKYLGVNSTGAGKAIRLMARIRRDYIPAQLYVVLDEAQIPAGLYRGAYRSDAEPSRPILREILAAWEITPYIIVSGTGLSEQAVKEVVGSAVAKTDIRQWLTCTNTGAFDSLEVQSAYISRYLPHHLVQSDSGQLLLRRCWSWLRGRHRFTATYLDILISNSFHSPHKILDEYVLHFTKKEAPDSPDFAGSEPELSSNLIESIRNTRFVDLKKITEVQ
ncbi:hypothetical protein L208DRAFT_265069 [Tricholoma matsutake]|nr:hypothetical protein L208DRAFT_265069 [Tricholoma matsutake 945]